MFLLIFALLTKVEIFADSTFESISNDRVGKTLVTCHSMVDIVLIVEILNGFYSTLISDFLLWLLLNLCHFFLRFLRLLEHSVLFRQSLIGWKVQTLINLHFNFIYDRWKYSLELFFYQMLYFFDFNLLSLELLFLLLSFIGLF